MLGKNKKIKEESLTEFKFSNIISKKLLFSETYCDIYQIRLINDKTEYLMKDIFLESNAQEDEIRKEIVIINKINNTVEKPKSFLKFYGFVLVEDTINMEKSFYLFFDLVSDSLASLMKKKKTMKSRFNFNEIYSAYRALLNSMTYLQVRNVRHRKICPENIFCNVEEELFFSSVKISDFTNSELKQNKSKFLFSKDISDFDIKYASPEMRNLNISNGIDLYKADVFALGILILEMGTFTFPTNLEYKEGEFSYVDTNEVGIELDVMFKDMKKNYKDRIKPLEKNKFEFFMDLLKSMLSLDIQIRPDFIELYKNSIFMSDEDILNHIMIEEKRYTLEDLSFKKTLQQCNANTKFIVSSIIPPKKNEETQELKQIINQIHSSDNIKGIQVFSAREEGFDDFLTKIYDQIKHIHFTNQIKYITFQSNFTRTKKNTNFIPESFFNTVDPVVRESEIKCIHEHKAHWLLIDLISVLKKYSFLIFSEKGLTNDEIKLIMNLMELHSNLYENLETFRIFFDSGDYLDDLALQTIIQKLEKFKKQRLKSFEFGFRASKFEIETMKKLLFIVKKKFAEDNKYLDSLTLLLWPRNDFAYDENLQSVVDLLSTTNHLKCLNLYIGMISFRAPFTNLMDVLTKKLDEVHTLSLGFSSGWLTGGGGPINDKNILPLLKFLKLNLTYSLKHFSLILNCGEGLLVDSMKYMPEIFQNLSLIKFNIQIKGNVNEEIDQEVLKKKYNKAILAGNKECLIEFFELSMGRI